MDSIPVRTITSVLLILFVMVVRFAQVSVEMVSEARLNRMAEEGSKKAKVALKLMEKESRIYNCLKIISVFAEVLCACIVTVMLNGIIGEKNLHEYMYLILLGGMLVLAIIFQIFCVYFPRIIASKNSEKILFSLMWLINLLYYIITPVERVLYFIASVLLLPFGVKHDSEDDEDVTEEEIRFMVDIGSESGAIDPDEKEMIHNIFELDDTPVKDVMTHRTDVEFLWKEEGLDVWEETISKTNHSVYPICGETVDDILGIIKTTDFYKLLRNNEDSDRDINSIIKSPYLVPETIKADDLFRKMQLKKNHFAIVLDEYGGLAGIITMSDLLEEIVGNLDSDTESVEEIEITQIDSNTWKILGSTEIEIVAQTLDIDLPIEEYKTFAGLVIGELGAIPDDGATAEVEAYGLQIKVTKIFEHRIEEVLVCKIDDPEQTEDKE